MQLLLIQIILNLHLLEFKILTVDKPYRWTCQSSPFLHLPPSLPLLPSNEALIPVVGCRMSVRETIKQRSTYTRRSNRGPLTLNSLTEKEKRQKGGTITQEHKDLRGSEAGTLLRPWPQQSPLEFQDSHNDYSAEMITPLLQGDRGEKKKISVTIGSVVTEKIQHKSQDNKLV